jgi:uncharacterized protein with ATP-grasp and redox domains
MKQLQPTVQCIDCLISMANDVMTLANVDNERLVAKAERISRDILADAQDNDSNSPQLANRILRKIRHLTGVEDPYAGFKSREMAQARKIFSQLKNNLADNLRSKASLAALGNSLDFFHNPAQALADIPHQLGNGFAFYRDDLDQLKTFLAQKPRRILYLTDNAGEVYFDIPLYDHLKQHCRQLYLVVKGGPALNDLTRAELRSADLQDRFEAVADTGTDGAGIDWDHVSREFLDLFASADLIISKGMANFETLYPRSIPAASFYLFKVKCEPIQNYIQAPVNSFMALWKDGSDEF